MNTSRSFRGNKMSIPLVLPPSWVARMNQLAMERGINRSALIREAIRATYFDRIASEESRQDNDVDGAVAQREASGVERRADGA